MLYIEHTPAPPLSRFVHLLWYAQAPAVTHSRERVLPTGRVQIVINLARDFLLDCPEGRDDLRMPPALVVGARSVYEIIHSSDLADLIGIVFTPGGFAPFASDAVDLFTNCSVALDALWGNSTTSLRDRLRESTTPRARLQCLEAYLARHLTARALPRAFVRPEVAFALRQFNSAPSIVTVRETAGSIGWSERRFSQVFRQAVGLSPKTWCRVQRFQRAVHQLHAGIDLPWAQLALDCGYYDQSHFANDFRAFSGIDATTYSARRTRWANHVPVD